MCWFGLSNTVVRADGTGEWTGSLEGRANYFWETSTRVWVPAVKARLMAPNGIRVGADYLVDVITSASIAQTGSDDDQLFTELRHGAGVEIGNEFDLGLNQLDIGLYGTYSTEDDYTSFFYGARGALLLDEKNTTLRFAVSRVQDEIRANNRPEFAEDMSGLTLSAGLEQVLNPLALISLGYQFGYLEGFLSNPYRRVTVTGRGPTFESHPDERFRHTASMRFAFFVPATDTAIHILLSAYADSWEIEAITPELRIYQQIGDDFLIRLRNRFYTQSAAWFQRMPYPEGWDGPVTNDPKMTEFITNTLGIHFEYRLSFLRGSFLDFAQHSWIDIGIDRYWNTNSYGDGVIGTAGGRLEF